MKLLQRKVGEIHPCNSKRILGEYIIVENESDKEDELQSVSNELDTYYKGLHDIDVQMDNEYERVVKETLEIVSTKFESDVDEVNEEVDIDYEMECNKIWFI